MEIINTKCPTLDTLIINFQKFIENEVENECNYIKDGTLHYIEYDIPTAYIASYGNNACIDTLTQYLESSEINRKIYMCNYINCDTNDYKKAKSRLLVCENMYAKYKYQVDFNYDKGDKYCVSSNNADGILFPIVIKKTNDFNDDTDDCDGDECKK